METAASATDYLAEELVEVKRCTLDSRNQAERHKVETLAVGCMLESENTAAF
jgi:hypothetical protein